MNSWLNPSIPIPHNWHCWILQEDIVKGEFGLLCFLGPLYDLLIKVVWGIGVLKNLHKLDLEVELISEIVFTVIVVGMIYVHILGCLVVTFYSFQQVGFFGIYIIQGKEVICVWQMLLALSCIGCIIGITYCILWWISIFKLGLCLVNQWIG